ncbi:hypothetical protein FSARC_14721 [Fusarium sarcochroum]|uniref:Trichothecene 3-O-acetyltransferase n=1 Tax=Fusarium sarcochroum TaxID=1208366 RepID=A0A8H4SRB4_9HYPO|nr:hypothetical protein FSARC_14721 [Fusarium sarcochroum]
MANTTQVEQLTPLDLLMPRTYVGAFFTFKTTTSVESAQPKLQHGLDNLFRRLPWLTGRVFPTSQARGKLGADEVPRLEVRWSKTDAAPVLVNKGILDAQYTTLAGERMPPSAILADKWPVPSMIDDTLFKAGAPVFGASLMQFSDKQGLALCISVHHNVVDATGFAEVVKAWTESIEGKQSQDTVLGLNRLSQLSEALSTELKVAEGHSTTEIFALHPEYSSAPPTMPTSFAPCTAKLFTVPISKIDALKAQLDPAPTTNTLICALLWSAITRARLQRNPDLIKETSKLAMGVNGRSRLGKEISTSDSPYFGNTILYSLAEISTADLEKASDLSQAQLLAPIVEAIAQSVSPNKISQRHVAEAYTLAEKADNYQTIFPGWDLFSSRDFTITSWADLDLYNMSFGADLGKPEFIRSPYVEADGVALIMPRKRSADELVDVVLMLRKDDLEALGEDRIQSYVTQ